MRGGAVVYPIASRLLCLAAAVNLALFTFATGCGGSGGSLSTPPPPAAPTASITATPTSVTVGNSTSLSYNCTNSTSCALTATGTVNNPVPSGSFSGTVTESPTATITYTLTATGSGGTATATATVTVTAAVTVPKPTISATPGAITLGQSIQLTWNCDTGTTVSVSGPGMTTSTACTGSNFSVTPPATGSNTYTISSKNAAGTGSTSYTVTVNAPAPTASLTCTPTSVTLGNSVSCTIATTNATQVIANSTDGSWTGSVVLNGTVSVTPTSLTGSVQYSVNVTGTGGSATASSAVITVTNPAIQLTSINPVAQWVVGQNGFPAFNFIGKNLAAGQLTSCTPDPNIHGVQLVSSTEETVTLAIDQVHEGSGYRFCKICKSDGTGCSASVPLGLYSQNMAAAATSGETFVLNPQETVTGQNGNGNVDKFTPAGVPDGKFPVGAGNCCNSVDNVTGYVFIDRSVFAEDGVSDTPNPQFQANPVAANAAKNGIVAALQPTAPNNVSFANITGPNYPPPPVTTANVGADPQSLAITVLGGKTYLIIVTAGSAPALWSVDTTNVTNIISQPLTGATASLPGGSAIVTFDSLGIGMVIDFAGKVAIPFSLSTLKPVGSPIALPGIPVSATADPVNSIAVIGNADQPNNGGTLTEVNPVTGTATLVPSVETSVLPVGTVPATTGKGFLVCPQDGISSCTSYPLP